MAVKLIVTYFPLRGRAETSRLVLHAAKKDFVDNHVPVSDWAALKPKTPFEQLPNLSIGDKVFAQGQAIASYLAREYGLYGSSNLDALKIEQLQQLREELLIEEIAGWKEKDSAKKAEITKKMNETVYPRYLGFFERLIKENQAQTKTEFTVGNKLSLADIIVFAGTETVQQQNASLLTQYPAVNSVRALVADQDGVKRYLKNRPVTAL